MANFAVQLAVSVGVNILFGLMAPRPPDQEGPRLDDTNIPAVNPGNPIPRGWSRMKSRGQLIWADGIKETKHDEKVKGGKGVGQKSPRKIWYTYSASVAVAVCEGEATIEEIWAGEKIVYRNPLLTNAELEAARIAYEAERRAYWEDQWLYSTYTETSEPEEGANRYLPNPNYYTLLNGDKVTVSSVVLGNPTLDFSIDDWIDEKVAEELAQWDLDNSYGDVETRYSQIETFIGSETQTPSSIIEGVEGAGNVPGFRGTTYFVMEDLQLADFGNTIPQFRVKFIRHKPGETGADRYNDWTLTDTIRDLMDYVGMVELTDYEIDAGLVDYTLNGMVFTRYTSVREALRILQTLFPVDFIERDGIIKCRNRDRATQAVVPEEDLRTHVYGRSPPPAIERERISDLELPKEIVLNFQDKDRNYSKNSARSLRQVTNSTKIETQDLPVASNTVGMLEAADRVMSRFISERTTFKLFLPPEYMEFYPGDVLQIPLPNGDQRLVRIAEQDIGANMIVECLCVDHIGEEADIQPTFSDDYSFDDLPVWLGKTIGEVMDLPNLSDENEANGVYVAFGNSTTGDWFGGALYQDVNAGTETPVFGENVIESEGTTWELGTSNTDGVAIGVTNAGLTAVNPHIVDRENILSVQFKTRNPSFSSQTFEQATRGRNNVFLVGNEVVQALSAVDRGGNNWEFSGLLRGQRGTEWAMYEHTARDRVVHLTQGGVTRWEIEPVYVDGVLEYRVAGMGTDLLAGDTRSFLYVGREELAWPPAITVADRNLDGDLSLEWVPRARYEGLWVNGSGATNKDSTDYRLEIVESDPWDAESYEVLETYELSDTTFEYSVDDQIYHFGSAQSEVNIVLRQYSANGRLGLPRYQKV